MLRFLNGFDNEFAHDSDPCSSERPGDFSYVCVVFSDWLPTYGVLTSRVHHYQTTCGSPDDDLLMTEFSPEKMKHILQSSTRRSGYEDKSFFKGKNEFTIMELIDVYTGLRSLGLRPTDKEIRDHLLSVVKFNRVEHESLRKEVRAWFKDNINECVMFMRQCDLVFPRYDVESKLSDWLTDMEKQYDSHEISMDDMVASIRKTYMQWLNPIFSRSGASWTFDSVDRIDFLFRMLFRTFLNEHGACFTDEQVKCFVTKSIDLLTTCRITHEDEMKRYAPMYFLMVAISECSTHAVSARFMEVCNADQRIKDWIRDAQLPNDEEKSTEYVYTTGWDSCVAPGEDDDAKRCYLMLIHDARIFHRKALEALSDAPKSPRKRSRENDDADAKLEKRVKLEA